MSDKKAVVRADRRSTTTSGRKAMIEAVNWDLLVDGNPLEDLGAVTDSNNLRIIMKDGVIYKNDL